MTILADIYNFKKDPSELGASLANTNPYGPTIGLRSYWLMLVVRIVANLKYPAQEKTNIVGSFIPRQPKIEFYECINSFP
jgi:hypothetical protein